MAARPAPYGSPLRAEGYPIWYLPATRALGTLWTPPPGLWVLPAKKGMRVYPSVTLCLASALKNRLIANHSTLVSYTNPYPVY